MQTKKRPCSGNFFLKINKRVGQIQIHVQDGINMQGEFFLKNNKRADQNRAVHVGIFSQNNKCACKSIQYTRVHTVRAPL